MAQNRWPRCGRTLEVLEFFIKLEQQQRRGALGKAPAVQRHEHGLILGRLGQALLVARAWVAVRGSERVA